MQDIIPGVSNLRLEIAIVLLLTAALILFIVTLPPQRNTTTTTTATVTTTSTSTATTTTIVLPIQSIHHIIIIVMENKGFNQVIGNSSAPYQNMIANNYSLAAAYYAVSHPSLPNYLALTGGSTFAVTSDCSPSTCMQTSTNIVDLLKAKQLTWKEYAESMPQPCYSQDSGLYAVRHNPFVYYADITANSSYCNARVVPLGNISTSTGAFFSDLKNNSLPNYAFITPNLCDDAHDCPESSGDQWLSKFVPMIISSSSFKNTLIFIVYDEGIDNANGGGKVAAIIVGPNPPLKTGFKSYSNYNHYSLISTVERIFNLGNLGRNDSTASGMTSDIITRGI